MFKAITRDAEVPVEQEIHYIRKYIKGEVQKVVGNLRKRRYGKPVKVLRGMART